MDNETKDKLIELGRQDLVDAYEITVSGYAGINGKGTIVDRRKFPEAIPCQKNPMFNLPEPKVLTVSDLDLECKWCDYLVSCVDEDTWGNVCRVCGRDLSVFKCLEL